VVNRAKRVGARGLVDAPARLSAEVLPYEAVFEAASFGIVVTDVTRSDHPVVRVNSAFCEMTGYSVDEVVGRNCRFLQGPDTDEATLERMCLALERGESFQCVVLNYRKDGSPFWNELRLTPISGDDGVVVGFVGFQSDVTEHRRRQEEAGKLERRLQAAADNMPGFIFQRSRDAKGEEEFLYCSPSLNRLLEIPNRPLSFGDYLGYIHPDDVEALTNEIRQSHQTGASVTAAYRMLTASGCELAIRGFSTARTLPDGKVVWDGVGIDVTAERRANDDLAYLMSHDPLTGLQNRVALELKVGDFLANLDDPDKSVVVFTAEIEDLAEILDALGPTTGDGLLRAMGRRLSAFALPGGAVARIGDAKFSVSATLASKGVSDIAAMLGDELARPFCVEGSDLNIRCAMGMAVHPCGALDNPASPIVPARGLIMKSEVALWEGRREVRREPVLYSPDIDQRVSSRVRLRQSLHEAVAERRFEVHYQPVQTLGDGRIVGAEALVRWPHKDGRFRMPDQFIPLAEESGLIVPLGEWVLEQTMRQARLWDTPRFGSPRLAVNVSGAQLHRSDFVATLRRLLDRTGVDPRRIELELTEGFLIHTSPKMIDTVERIRDLGFGLTIDDFGTGYASYESLKQLPVDKLKIDQVFIRQLTAESSDLFIVRAIIAMAKSLRLETVCEGIETTIQRDVVRQEGCELGQGYLFARPMPAGELEQRLVFDESRAPRLELRA
jgi:PAS domain S-box-containing protein